MAQLKVITRAAYAFPSQCAPSPPHTYCPGPRRSLLQPATAVKRTKTEHLHSENFKMKLFRFCPFTKFQINIFYIIFLLQRNCFFFVLPVGLCTHGKVRFAVRSLMCTRIKTVIDEQNWSQNGTLEHSSIYQ